ncbi:DUF7507 domain-containing protein [Psychromicrobium silvestre]|uniref:DUF7507 domain-containing protein n=1 Tax=Psychromicrobium silvestre TaxID=1645614 RepID=UPI0015CBA734
MIVVSTAPPAQAVGTPLSCDGTTIYSAQRGSTGTTASDGAIYGLTTSAVGSAAVTNTLITTIPTGGFVNAIGITQGGTALYGVNQSTLIAGQTIVYRYDAVGQSWTQYVGTGGPVGATYQTGAVDPANGIYYYATYLSGTATTPARGLLYGFNTNTNQAIPGVIATFALPTGASAAGVNGDLAFDSTGNLYLLTSNSSISAIGVVSGPLPVTGSASGAPLTDTVLTTFPATASYVGIAFDNAGNLYTESGGVGSSAITKFNPNTGAVVSGPTPTSTANNAQALMQTDLAACSTNPTLSVSKDIVGRYSPSDQFTMSITGGGISQGNTATTTGSTTGLQPEPAVAGPVIATSGSTYTIAEIASSGNLLNYASTYSCVDTANGNALIASGTGQSFTLQFPATTRGKGTPNIACRFTNTPLLNSLTLQKSVAESTLVVGQTLHYSFLVTNTGNTVLAPVSVIEGPFTGTGAMPAVSCPAGATSLAPGASVTCTASYVVEQADVDRGTIHNAATAQGVTPAGDPVDSNESTADVPELPAASLTFKKTVAETSLVAGETLHYSFLVTNTGNVTLAPVAVNEATFTGIGSMSAVSCPAGATSLAPGASVTCTASYVVEQADVDRGTVDNSATATGTPPTGPAVTTPPSSADVPGVSTPALTIAKTASPTIITAVGQTITYSFLVTNTGNVTLAPVQVNEGAFSGTPANLSPVTCPAEAASLAPGENLTCTATYKTTQVDIDNGKITNTATATGTPPNSGTPVDSPPSTATVTVNTPHVSPSPTPSAPAQSASVPTQETSVPTQSTSVPAQSTSDLQPQSVLANTGISSAPIVEAGIVALLLGLVMLQLSRRRSSKTRRRT